MHRHPAFGTLGACAGGVVFGPANNTYEVGVELDSQDNVWGVPFAQADWTVGMDPATTLWTLARMLEEKGIITRDELRARVTGGVRPSAPGGAVPWMNHGLFQACLAVEEGLFGSAKASIGEAYAGTSESIGSG
jgi:hypothetical protein